MKREIKKYFIPRTILGKWSIKFIIAFVLLMILSQILAVYSSKQRIDDLSYISSSERMFIVVSGLLALISGVAAFFTGIIGITKKKERSIFVYISTLIGFFVLIFIIGEILVPH